jgi:predicted RNase H-like HicB family nuclease
MADRYTIIVRPEPDDLGYFADVPALPGCYSRGDDPEEAVRNAQEAIALALEDLAARGEPIPEDVAAAA